MPRVNTGGNKTDPLDFGPGGVTNRPLSSRYMKIQNNTAPDLFYPDATAPERLSVYNNLNVPGVVVYKGRYPVSTTLHDPKARMGLPGGSPCWSPGVPDVSAATGFRVPAGCASGFTDEGVTNTANQNPNLENRDGVVYHGNQAWEFYQALAYGCPAPFVANISVRRCSV